MQTYDIFMLIVLAGTTLFGFVKGLAWQLAYVASLVVSYFAAVQFSPQVAPMFGDSEPFNRFVAMLAIYVITSFLIWTMFRGVSGVIDRVKLNEFDRQLGGLIGFARGVLWCIAITFFAATLLESYRPAILGSKSGHYIAVLLDKSHSVLPEEIHEVIHPYVERIEQGLDPNRPAGSGLPGRNSWPSPTGQGGDWGFRGGATSSGNQQSQAAPPTRQPTNSAAPTPWPSTNSGPAAWPGGNTSQATQPRPWPADNRTPAQPVGDRGF